MHMYRFACKDVGVDCTFVATGASVDEVKNKAFAHAGVVHADIMKGMSEARKEELTKQVVASIKKQ